MKILQLIVLILLTIFMVLFACHTTIGAEATPAPFAKQPLTLSHAEVVATIQHMQALAKQAEADTDAAKAAEQAEHQAHVAAQSDADAAKVEAANLGKAAAQAAAQRDAQKARADALAEHIRQVQRFLFFHIIGSFLLIYFAGAAVQSAFRWAVSTLWQMIKIPLFALKALVLP